MNIAIGESTCYKENSQTLQLGLSAWWQQKILLETPIEDVLSHEIMHDVLTRFLGSDVSTKYDYISYRIECPCYRFWAEGEGLELIRTRQFNEPKE